MGRGVGPFGRDDSRLIRPVAKAKGTAEYWFGSNETPYFGVAEK